MSDDQIIGLAAIAAMVAYPFVGAWLERIASDRRRQARRNHPSNGRNLPPVTRVFWDGGR